MRGRAILTAALVCVGCTAPPLVLAQEAERLVTRERIAALPPPARDAWSRYLATSERLRAADEAAVAVELRAAGRSELTPAPQGPSSGVGGEITDEWVRSEQARRIADNALSYQTPAGGWSKSVDLARGPRQPGVSYATSEGWSWVGTFDNGATTEHLRLLAGVYRAHHDTRHRDAYQRGLEYVLTAQFPNGCWPQVFPLRGSYHDAATYNDDATLHILTVLQDAARSTDDLVTSELRDRARAAVERGVECIVASQVIVDGKRTVWGAQHDPITLAPVKARTYEHASLSGGESAGLMEFLMALESPSPAVQQAVHAAAAWFRENAIRGYEYNQREGTLVAKEGAGPIWARFSEIGTNRPIFSNRDGVIRYRFEELEDERRLGYAWFKRDAERALRRYEGWVRTHPAPG